MTQGTEWHKVQWHKVQGGTKYRVAQGTKCHKVQSGTKSLGTTGNTVTEFYSHNTYIY